MDAYNTMLARRSIRKFQDKPVCTEDIDKMLRGAMSAPSACNKQPWEFYVVTNAELLGKLQNSSLFSRYKSPCIVVVAGNKKHCITQKENDFFYQDCSAAVENLLLVATQLGLGTCWCGLSPMKAPADKVSQILGLEKHIVPVALVHVGHPAESKEPRTQYNEKKVHFFN